MILDDKTVIKIIYDDNLQFLNYQKNHWIAHLKRVYDMKTCLFFKIEKYENQRKTTTKKFPVIIAKLT